MTYRQALALLLVIHLLFFHPLLMQRAVVFPFSNQYEVSGIRHQSPDEYPSNPKFSDHAYAYIPEINHNLTSDHYQWLAVWNPSVQMGRPSHQLIGFNRSFLITNVIMHLTRDVLTFYAIQVVLLILFTSLFFFLFLKALDLSPLTCLISAVALSLSTFTAYWITFPMFLSALCCAVALLWLITKCIQRLHWSYLIGISFAAYCFVMTGYPQAILFYAYIIVIQTAVTLKRYCTSGRQAGRLVLAGMGASVLGVMAALPCYLDLWVLAQRSSRLNIGTDFFLSVLPKFQNLSELGLMFTTAVDPMWIGNPIDPAYPFLPYNGFSLTPLYFTVLEISLTPVLLRKFWYWHLFSAYCLLATLWPPAYLFAIRYLGFGFSRTVFWGGAFLPSMVLLAYSLEWLLQHPQEFRGPRRYLWLLLPNGMLTLAYWSIYQQLELPWHWEYAIASWLFVLGILLFIYWPQQWLFVALTTITVFIYSYPLLLMRPEHTIQVNSPLIEAIRQQTEDGSRYALLGEEMVGILPSNQEGWYQIPSIHSYDTAAPRNYQKMAAQLSTTGVAQYGRAFTFIDEPKQLLRPDFPLTGVGLVVSQRSLTAPQFQFVDQVNAIQLYRLSVPPILRLQTPHYQMTEGGVTLKPPYDQPDTTTPDVVEEFDDYRVLKVAARSESTLLFLSQQHHPFWQATNGDGQPLQTVLINEFYQGVIVPPHTDTVILAFRPFALWSWVPQVLYGGIGAAMLGHWLWRQRPIPGMISR